MFLDDPANPLPFEVKEELKCFVRYGKGLIDGGGYKTARIVAYAGVEHVNSAEWGRLHDATVISVQGVYLGGKQVAALLGRLHFEILRGVRGVRDGWARVLQPHEEELETAYVDAVRRFLEQNNFKVVVGEW